MGSFTTFKYLSHEGSLNSFATMAFSVNPMVNLLTIVAIISDIHSNFQALDAVLKDIRSIGVDEIWCTGDIVGYYTDPARVLRKVIYTCSLGCIVKGNHDDIAGKGVVPDYWNAPATAAILWTTKRLNIKERQYLHKLPAMLSLERQEKNILLVHGGPEYPLEQYINPIDHDYLDNCVDLMEFSSLDYIFLGHTHVPFIYTKNGRTIVNSGSVGQPRDGDPRASYCTFCVRSGEITFQRVSYDLSSTVEGIKREKLPPELANRLLSGI